MALEGKALNFAEGLKKSLKEEGIDIDKKTGEVLEGFQKALKKSMTGYTAEAAETTSKNVTSEVSENLKKIETLCKNCFVYDISANDYNNIKKVEPRFSKQGEALSEDAAKLAKALYLKLILTDFSLKQNDTTVPAVVYCAANLCKERRTIQSVLYSNMAGGGKKHPHSSTDHTLCNKKGNSLYDLVPGLRRTQIKRRVPEKWKLTN